MKHKLTTKGDPTMTLVSRRWKQPRSIEELYERGPSAHGWHSGFHAASCLEEMRLRRLGTKHERDDGYKWDGSELNALATGSVWHVMLEGAAKGKDPIKVLHQIDGVPVQSREKLETMWLAYEMHWGEPPWSDEYKLIGIEAEIQVDIGSTGEPFSCRFDKILIDSRGRAYSIDHKSLASFNDSTLMSYTHGGQFITQAWAWDQHPLSGEFGRLRHVLDVAVKPSARKPEADFHREPFLVTDLQKERVQEDLVGQVQLRRWLEKKFGYTQSWPRSYACFGRYGPCDFLQLCHGAADNNYVQPCR